MIVALIALLIDAFVTGVSGAKDTSGLYFGGSTKMTCEPPNVGFTGVAGVTVSGIPANVGIFEIDEKRFTGANFGNEPIGFAGTRLVICSGSCLSCCFFLPVPSLGLLFASAKVVKGLPTVVGTFSLSTRPP